MNETVMQFWGKTRFWWIILILGVLLIPAGIWLIISPMAGYVAISIILGWSLVLFGIVQLLVSSDAVHHSHGWGWWLAGGIFDIFIGFILVGNLILSELILPYFFAFVLLFKSISNIISSLSMVKANKYWWLYMINGILLLIVSFIFFYTPFMSAYVIIFLSAFAFIYWGINLILFSIDIKPNKRVVSY